jgi:predicted 3-demethylubiquinone-9 3-methyltransferase (glyoxalase superfamily)
MEGVMQKIVPNLWFDTQAKEAAEFYCAVFPNSKILSHVVLRDTPSGDCDFMTFNLSGQDFMAISAGPYFKINPSISFILNFDPSQDEQAAETLKSLWDRLIDGGTALMPLQEYPFSKQYGWVQDKFGVSWQLMLTNPEGEPRPFITPSLMFAGDHTNKAEEAVQFYMNVFKNTKQGTLTRYTEDTGPAKKGSLMFADFMLENQWLAAMDSGAEQTFTFNEGTSLLINCDTQEEIDYYWEQLTAIPEAEQCGWLKDKYGVSWQVSPSVLNKMMREGTPEQMARVTQTFLKMKKFNIAEIEAAYHGTDPA